VYDHDSIARALSEAIELWLARHRQTLVEAESTANDRAYETLREELEHEYKGKWIVIAHGQLQGIGDSLAEVDQLASTASDRIVIQVGEDRPREIDLGWQMALA
jgi:hypothetical protein